MKSRCPQLCVLLALCAAMFSLLFLPRSEKFTPEPNKFAAGKSFDGWLDQNIGDLRSSTNIAPKELEQGIELAKLRAAEMRELIENDPRAALEKAVSISEYASLPEQLRAHVERPFSAPAELLALPICSAGSRTMHYELVIGDDSFTATVFGRREKIGTKDGTPLQGITLDGLAAVREEVFQIVESQDAEHFPEARSNAEQCFASGKKLGATAVTALAGGKRFHFASTEVLAEFDQRVAALDLEPGPHTGAKVIFLQADGDDGFDWEAAEGEVELQASAWTETPKDVYFIRIDFPADTDDTGASISQTDLENLMATTVNDAIAAMSYGKTGINGTVSPIVVHMTNPSSTYTPTNNNALHNDAKAAALAQIAGLDLNDYDIVGVHFTDIGMGSSALSSYSGLAGGGRQWIQGNSSSNVMIHEFGHNYGVGHTSFWETSDGSVVGTGASDEYGDDFDIMGDGPNNAHMHPQAKERLDWLEPAQWTDVTAAGPGTFRVYRFDDPDTTGTTRGLRITKGASEYYWLGYRRNLTSNQWLRNGAYLIWQRPGETRSWLLDTTPGSAAGRDDGAIVFGKTYSDTTAGVHITTLGSGGSAPDDWIDVRVNLGSFSGNSDPTATLSGPTTANARETVTFTVTGSDPNGDDLAYFWDFGDSMVESNSATQERSWAVGGTYSISVTTTDMKGGTVTKTQSVTVSDPLDNFTQRTSGTSSDLFDIATDGTTLVAVGSGSGTYRTSTDGVTWGGGTVNSNIYFRGIVWDGSQFLAAGQDYEFGASEGWRGVIHTSPDGSAWTERFFGGVELNDIASSGSVHVAVGDGGTIWRSTNGTSWSPIASGTSVNLNGVSYGDGGFVAVGAANNGSAGVVLTSSNGSSWSDASSGASLASWHGFYDVDYCNDRFLASGWYTKIRHSTDGGTNFLTTRTTSEQIAGFAYGNGIYFTDGKDTTKFSITYIRNLISTDGETWTALDTETSQSERNGAIFFDNTFITVADDGQIWQSDTFVSSPSTNPFETWVESYFPGADASTAALQDDDGDGSTNLQEFASNSDPTSAASSGTPEISEMDGYLALTVAKNPAASDVSYSVEISTDMVNWTTTGTVVVIDDASSLTVRSATAINNPSSQREFFRAVFTLSE